MHRPRNGWASIKTNLSFAFSPLLHTHSLTHTLSNHIPVFLFLTLPPSSFSLSLSLSLHSSSLSFLSQRLTCYQYTGDLTAKKKKTAERESGVAEGHFPVSLLNLHVLSLFLTHTPNHPLLTWNHPNVFTSIYSLQSGTKKKIQITMRWWLC